MIFLAVLGRAATYVTQGGGPFQTHYARFNLAYYRFNLASPVSTENPYFETFINLFQPNVVISTLTMYFQPQVPSLSLWSREHGGTSLQQYQRPGATEKMLTRPTSRVRLCCLMVTRALGHPFCLAVGHNVRTKMSQRGIRSSDEAAT